MSYHKELLNEIIESWDEQKIFNYIHHLEQRQADADKWLREVKALYKKIKRRKKKPLDTGVRSGT